ncbi:MAG: type 4a pilus biogenesis protein PilO [Acidobacteriota bacterium]|nr:type 4a pilus biogenesis protein PilO [Blastocatellia bacterium]MDW8413349.1 type 4a pilus biogenesis protein PilO [Acidobacteriota bacterium]
MADGTNFLSAIPWYVQMLVLIIASVFVFFLVDYMMFDEIRQDTRKKSEEVAKLREENRKGAIVRDNLKAYQQRYAQAQDELNSLRELLPEDVEISKVLENIQQQAGEQKLVIRVFSPKDSVNKSFYKEKPINVQVSGLYNNLGRFFQQIATYRRIVNVSDVEIRKANEQTEARNIDASFTVTAYFASEQDIMNISSEEKGGK